MKPLDTTYPDKEGGVEDVFYGLSKAVRIDDELEVAQWMFCKKIDVYIKTIFYNKVFEIL